MYKKIFYWIAALAIGAMVYAFSIGIYAEKKQLELIQEAFETSDFKKYLSYTTPFCSKEPVYVDKNNDFEINVFKFIGEQNDKAFIAYTIFINNLNLEKFKISDELYNTEDQSNMIVMANGDVVFDYKESNENNTIAITYGYKIFYGYYYIFLPEEDNQFDISLYDFDNTLFTSLTIDYQLTIDTDKSIEENTQAILNDLQWQSGYTTSERVAFFIKSVNTVMTVYAVIVIGLFFLIFRKSIMNSIKNKIQKTN